MEKILERGKKGRPYAGIPPEARAAERRDALIRAGTRIFGTVGFQRATVRAICQEAKLNDRYFYAAFDSTDALLRSTYEHHAQRLRMSVKQAVAALGATRGGLDARIDVSLAAFFAFLRDTCAARVLLLEVMGVSAQTDATYQRNLSEFGKMIVTLVAPLSEDPDVRADQRIIGIALVGAMTNVGAAWLLTGYRDSEEKMVRNCRQVLLGALQHLAAR
ncbi:TetR family transcriptional regulator [Burkholderia singularis]|uniref:TetR family transcriptional regulator n=1 Tax=Burkholderia singularis TaxID=1503053 RepID=A0A118DQ17_9BURK|nr:MULTISPECIES: TetR family transcriptional regulator [Burkholderia]AOK31311.1 TetR family transcriptional regulator [Burkholderia sp. Bp7605]KVE28851.1 TetR family transcriptional regulator [Burkholderia singularis]